MGNRNISFDLIRFVCSIMAFVFLLLGNTHAAVWAIFIMSAFSAKVTIRY